MTTTQRNLGLTIIGAVSVAALVAVAGIIWSSKADRTDMLRLEAKIDRVIDVMCMNYQNARACR